MKAHLAWRNQTGARRGTNGLLNYQQLIGDGLLMLKDGGLLAGFWYEGRELEAASAHEREEIRACAHAAFSCLDGNWMLHVDAFRRKQREYIGGTFSEATDLLIDEERAQHATFLRTYTALYVTWLPPRLEQTKLGQKVRNAFAINDAAAATDVRAVLEKQVASFERKLEELAGALQRVVALRRMRTKATNCELLQALNLTVNHQWRPCRPPPQGMYIDTYLAHELFNQKDHLVYGGKCIAVVSVIGYPAAGSTVGILSELGRLPITYRLSHRFIALDYTGSRALFGRLQKAWERMQRSFIAQVMRDYRARLNEDAVKRVHELNRAFSDLESRTERYGHHTCTVILRADTLERAHEDAKLVVDAFHRAGFTAYVENLNTMEAWLGSFAGHGRQNLRKPGITAENLADLCPLEREWRGEPFSPNPMLPPQSPPLLQARTRSGDAFHLNLHIDDVGHTLILGPTGSGKSTLLALLASQFGRYPGAQVFAFDAGYSMMPIALARTSGAHYALACDARLALAPLASIDTAEDLAWAQDWLRTLFDEQKLALTPEQGMQLDAAVEDLAATTERASDRTLTALLAFLQDDHMRAALRFYTSGPGASVLNGEADDLRYARFTVFELSHLMELKSPVVVPTLLFLFREIERRLRGAPTLLILDEAWLPLGEARFAARIAAWLVGLRKLNCAVVLATQSPSQIASSPIRDAVLENCKTRILLANREARSSALRPLYAEHLQLSDEQIQLLAGARRKRDYLYVANGRSRQFSLALGPTARALLGATSQEELARIRQLYQQHGPAFVPEWLSERGLDDAAHRWHALHRAQVQGSPA